MNNWGLLLLRWLHFIGFASLSGGLLLQWREQRSYINKYIWLGSLLQLGTGLALTILKAKELDPTKILIKLILLCLIFLVAFIYRQKKASDKVITLLVILTLTEVAIAVFWS